MRDEKKLAMVLCLLEVMLMATWAFVMAIVAARAAQKA
jgi:hypothetical protein